MLRGAFALSEERLVPAVSRFLVLHDNYRVLATRQNDFDLLDDLLVQVIPKPAYAPEGRFSKSLLENVFAISSRETLI